MVEALDAHEKLWKLVIATTKLETSPWELNDALVEWKDRRSGDFAAHMPAQPNTEKIDRMEKQLQELQRQKGKGGSRGPGAGPPAGGGGEQGSRERNGDGKGGKDTDGQ